MPIIKSAIKRVRQTAKRRERNVALKRDIKSAVKAFQEKPSATTLAAAQSEIDTAVKKNLLHIRTAARRKATLARQAKEAGVKLTAAKAKSTTSTAKKAPAKSAAKPAASTAAKASADKKKPATKSAKPAAKKTAK